MTTVMTIGVLILLVILSLVLTFLNGALKGYEDKEKAKQASRTDNRKQRCPKP